MTLKALAVTTLGNKRFYELNDDPSVEGFDAPIGSEAFAKIGNTGKLFFKQSSAVTAWKELLSKSSSSNLEGAVDTKTFILGGPVFQLESIDSHRTILSDCVLTMIGASLKISGDSGSTVIKINGDGVNGSVSTTISLDANGSISSLVIPLVSQISFNAGDIVWVEITNAATGQVEDLCVDLLFGSPPVIDNSATTVLYHFENNLLDSSGNAHTLVAKNSTGYQFVTGRFGTGIQVTAQSEKISSTNALIGISVGDFTIEMQVKFSGYNGSTSYHFAINDYSGFSLQNMYGNIMLINSGVKINTPFPSSYYDGQFHHLAFVRKNNTGYVYFDGVLLGSGDASLNISDSAELLLFHREGYELSNNIYDEVRISNQAIYTGNFAPPSKQF